MEDVDTERLAGATRYGTAAAIAGEDPPGAFEGATTAILATGENFPDALAASGLAGDNAPAPILLTRTDELSPEALAALDELAIDEVIIVGGTAAVSNDVEDTLEDEGFTVDRVAGTNRYGTAAEIAEAMGDPADGTVIIATGTNYPDALAGGPLAYTGNHPILLVTPDSIPAETEAALEGADQAIILGGTAAVSNDVEEEIEDITGSDAVRLAGVNRYGTAVDVADHLLDDEGFDGVEVLLASGVNFPDALAGGPLGGELDAPIILTNTTSLPEESRSFLDDHSDTIEMIWVLGGTAAIDDATVDDAEDAAETVGNDQNQVRLTSRSVQQGGTLTGTITGDDIQSVTVSGCGLTNQTVGPDSDANTAGRQFSITIPASQPAGDCTLTFTITNTDGTTTTETERITVTGAAAQATASTRPELTAARIISTTTSGAATTAQPAGTVVRYTFDEAVTGRTPNPELFYVYRFNSPNAPVAGTSTCGAANTTSCATNVPGDANSVDVLFETLTNDAGVPAASIADLSVATVDLGAVADGQGQTNPEGDAPLGTGNQTVAAGRTSAPDLVSVGRYGATTTANQAAVDFVFDQNAFVQDPAGFLLILTDGTQVQCTGPAVTSNNTGAPSGQNQPGGNGTTTITATCNAPTTGQFANQTLVGGSNVARGIVLSGTVGTATGDPANGAFVACTTSAPGGDTSGGLNPAPGSNACNPLEASDTPDVETTANGVPELTGIELRPATNTTNPDQVLYTFDEAVLATGLSGADFRVYHSDGRELRGSAGGAGNPPAPERNPTNNNQVLVSFANGTIQNAVGGSVEDGAVLAAAGLNRPNQEDEEAASNVAVGQQGAGRTTGPDLISVTMSSSQSGFGQDYVATYTFDEPVQADVDSKFFLLLADGSRLVCATATIGANATSTPNNSQVTCTSFNFVDVVNGVDESGTNTGAATEAQIGSAVAGTVDDAAVTDGTNENPEGYETTTGGTGTPRQT